MPECRPCETAPLPSQQSFQSAQTNTEGKPPVLPDPTVQAGPPEGGFAQSSADQQAFWRAGRQRQAFAAVGTDPQGMTATRAVVLEGALPVARYLRPCRNRKSKLPRCKAQAAQAWQPRGLPCSEAPCQAAECSGRVLGATMASHRHPLHKPPEADNREGCTARKHSAGGWAQQPVSSRRRRTFVSGDTSRPCLATTRAAALGSTLPVA
jgi:hypothetical protein